MSSNQRINPNLQMSANNASNVRMAGYSHPFVDWNEFVDWDSLRNTQSARLIKNAAHLRTADSRARKRVFVPRKRVAQDDPLAEKPLLLPARKARKRGDRIECRSGNLVMQIARPRI